MPTCHVLKMGVAGPCSACGAELEGNAHVLTNGGVVELTCGACCALHGAQVSMEWDSDEVTTVAGTQAGLF